MCSIVGFGVEVRKVDVELSFRDDDSEEFIELFCEDDRLDFGYLSLR